MVKAHKIELHRLEGPVPGLPPDRESIRRIDRWAAAHKVVISRLDSDRLWDDANEILLLWSQTAPRSGTPHQVEFTVHYADTLKHHGFYPLFHWSSQQPDLGRHLADVVVLKSGIARPRWAPRWFWAWTLDITHARSVAYEDFARSHEIGQDQTALTPDTD